jgi:hypothetical protein
VVTIEYIEDNVENNKDVDILLMTLVKIFLIQKFGILLINNIYKIIY